ncbi:MAG: hypothetical protein ACI959_001145 [Limisphaerales bacterium]|jgi:hypothetical protein
MKKVLIISYFFPPCNLTAANRVGSWAEQLSDFGYYPIVVTRNWNKEVTYKEVLTENSVNQVEIVKNARSEVHYLPYFSSLRDKLFTKPFPLNQLSKPLTLFELVGQNFSNLFIPYSNIETYCEELLKANTQINVLVASAGPYPLFRFASRLKQKNPKLKWIADYRDDWTTKSLNKPSDRLSELIESQEKRSEKKWVGSAERIVSVSDTLTGRISKFTGIQGITIPNGFSVKLLDSVQPIMESKKFIISYSGYLYAVQQVEQFLELFKAIVDKYKSKITLVARFIGLAYHRESVTRVRNAMLGYEEYLDITPRISIEKCIQFEKQADILLMMAYGSEKGIPSSKIYQYVGLKKPVLIYPTDGDIIEKILKDTEQAVIPEDIEDGIRLISESIESKLQGKPWRKEVDIVKILNYSRLKQTEKLASLLDSI